MCAVATADADRDEPVQDKIIRMQKTLGGAFNGVWAAWVTRAALGQELSGSQKSNPKLNTVETCAEFIEAWSDAGHDAYKMGSELGLSVNWTA
eukprot:837916-Pyramimonas_sp.AAC.1